MTSPIPPFRSLQVLVGMIQYFPLSIKNPVAITQ
uniref:Uncharacterized protein n=1 Tax=Anguilla anguilla TaxID=7936 RepID=A0A0E9W0R9_ANGAN